MALLRPGLNFKNSADGDLTIATADNIGLNAVDVTPTIHEILPAKITGFPSDVTLVLRGNGTWGSPSAGSSGAAWYTGSGIPSGGLGSDGDMYLRTNGEVYKKVTGAWVDQTLNLTGGTGATGAAGSAGATGAAGTNGATWYVAASVPSSGTGANGDWFLRTTDGEIYKKVAGTWTDQSVALVGSGGGGGSGDMTLTINQVAHGFAVGNLVRVSGSDTFTKAKADSVTHAQVAGIVSSVVDADNFHLTTGGRVSGLSSLTPGTQYFLDPTTAGAYTSTEPVTVGQVSKPVLLALDATAALFINQDGDYIAGTGGGTTWYTGSAAPSTLHNDGDFYLRTSNGEVYKQVSAAWVDQTFSLLGPTGATGATGVSGATWYTGSSVPSTLHANGDFYIRTSNGEVYKQVAGAWVDQGFSLGNISTPPIVTAQASATTPITSITAGTWTSIPLDSEDVDTNDMHSTSSNTERFTCVTEGYYYFSGRVVWKAGTGQVRTRFLKNGATAYNFTALTLSGSFDGISDLDDAIFYLTAGDYIELQGYATASSQQTVAGSQMACFRISGGSGSTWYSGSGAPVTLHNDNDYYLRSDTGEVYKQVVGAWADQSFSLRGAVGSTWYTGSAAPVTLYNDGDFYLRTTNGEVYKQVSAAWVDQSFSLIQNSSVWYTGAGAPSTLHVDGDFYLRQSNGEVYKQVTGAWVDQSFSLIGPTGATGSAGANGTTWYTGSAAPSTLHNNGDYYLRTTNGEVYKQVSGAWVDQSFTLAGTNGANGTTWYTGSAAPSTLHTDGDYYLRTSNGEVYKQVTGAWVDQTFSLLGPTGTGSAIYGGTSAPSGGLGVIGDWYFRTTGAVYKKTGSSTWTDQSFPHKQSIGAWAGVMPTITGTGVVVMVPQLPIGTNATFDLSYAKARVEVPAIGSNAQFQIEKSAGGGAFSGSPVLISTMTITPGTYEDDDTFAPVSVSSGDLLRIRYAALGGVGGSAGYSVYLQGSQSA